MTTKPTSSRRKFLATLGVGGAAAAAVALNRQAAEPTPKSEVAAPQGPPGTVTLSLEHYY